MEIIKLKSITWDDIRKRAEWWSSFLKELKPWKKIQQKNSNGEWIDIDSEPSFGYLMDSATEDYQIVDRPTRPFKDIEEFKNCSKECNLSLGVGQEIKLITKRFDTKDKYFVSQDIEIYLDFIISRIKDKELETFHALYDNTLMYEAPFGVVCKDGEIYDSDNIPVTPIKTFGELKNWDWIHALIYLEQIDAYRYEGIRISRIKDINKSNIEIFLGRNYQSGSYCDPIIKVKKNTSCWAAETHDKHPIWIFTNYFEMKRKYKELKKLIC